MSTHNRKACRQGRRCDARSLGDALYCTVHHSDVEAKQLAERLGIRYGYLLDAANPDREEAQFQLRLLLPLVVATGRTEILDYLEREVGRVAFAVPTAADPAQADLFDGLAMAMRELGEDAEALRQAVADGRVTRDEAERFGAEVDETIAALAKLKALVTAKVRSLSIRRPA